MQGLEHGARERKEDITQTLYCEGMFVGSFRLRLPQPSLPLGASHAPTRLGSSVRTHQNLACITGILFDEQFVYQLMDTFLIKNLSMIKFIDDKFINDNV